MGQGWPFGHVSGGLADGSQFTVGLGAGGVGVGEGVGEGAGAGGPGAGAGPGAVQQVASAAAPLSEQPMAVSGQPELGSARSTLVVL